MQDSREFWLETMPAWPGNAENRANDFQCYGWSPALHGSRNRSGNVPNCNWNDDKFNVNWYNPQNANPNLRARVEVSPRQN